MTATAFSTLPFSPEFLANLDALAYREMTPIQAQSLPAIMAGRDVKAQAKTGSGKTAAFGIGLLQAIDPSHFHPQALVLCPTRELADQVSKELRRLARPVPNTKILTLCGGTPMGPQLASLEHPPHVVVGTPGRILKHCQKQRLDLRKLKILVLDEADRMLDMGFADDIHEIIGFTSPRRQTLLFSATYPPEIRRISESVQNSPLEIKVESLHQQSVIRQVFYEVPKGGKTNALVALLQHVRPESCAVFCGRKQQCQDLADELRQLGFQAQALQGDMEQRDRDQVLVRFANKSISVLVATDVAARGLDIKDLSAVVNYELSPDPEIHVHRIGRTGRAGSEGLALSLFHTSEAPKVTRIQNYLQEEMRCEDISAIESSSNDRLVPPMVTLCINGGRKHKLRPGDILGALTGSKELQGSDIGKIDIFDYVAYVAVRRDKATLALKIMSQDKIKGRKMQVRKA